jgi:hypothetical protein
VSKRLSPKQLHARVTKRLRKSDNLNFLESFAMFMGKAQLVELALKKILVTKYGYQESRIERWTLGTAIKELKKCGLRKDFIALLEDLNDHRIHIAHELLVMLSCRNWPGRTPSFFRGGRSNAAYTR